MKKKVCSKDYSKQGLFIMIIPKKEPYQLDHLAYSKSNIACKDENEYGIIEFDRNKHLSITRKIFSRDSTLISTFGYETEKSKEEIEKYFESSPSVISLKKSKNSKRINANSGYLYSIYYLENTSGLNAYDCKLIELLLR